MFIIQYEKSQWLKDNNIIPPTFILESSLIALFEPFIVEVVAKRNFMTVIGIIALTVQIEIVPITHPEFLGNKNVK